jgi:hypothetical protein
VRVAPGQLKNGATSAGPRQWVFCTRSGNYGKNGGPVAVIRHTPTSAEEALAVPQDREAAIPLSAKSRGWVQLPDSVPGQ